MPTNLSGNILTLGDTSLDENYLKFIKDRYAPIDNCVAGDTVILDGIECLCVATDVTIQGSTLTRIAVDKNRDLGYYQNYEGINIGGTIISENSKWRWGGYETKVNNTSAGVGYGLQNTINCISNPIVYTNGASTRNNEYSSLWLGVSDFRSSHSDNWFVPSQDELINYIYPYVSSLTFDLYTGASRATEYWTSTELSSGEGARKVRMYNLSNGSQTWGYKDVPSYIRLCRAF